MIYIGNEDQCMTYFNWRQMHVSLNKQDLKEGYVYQKQYDF